VPGFCHCWLLWLPQPRRSHMFISSALDVSLRRLTYTLPHSHVTQCITVTTRPSLSSTGKIWREASWLYFRQLLDRKASLCLPDSPVFEATVSWERARMSLWSCPLCLKDFFRWLISTSHTVLTNWMRVFTSAHFHDGLHTVPEHGEPYVWVSSKQRVPASRQIFCSSGHLRKAVPCSVPQ
jgi:hypothetical protein